MSDLPQHSFPKVAHLLYSSCFFVFFFCLFVLLQLLLASSPLSWPSPSGDNHHLPEMVGLAPNWVRLASNGTNLGFFRSNFSTFLLMYICDEVYLKNTGFVPFGANSGNSEPHLLRNARIDDEVYTCTSKCLANLWLVVFDLRSRDDWLCREFLSLMWWRGFCIQYWHWRTNVVTLQRSKASVNYFLSPLIVCSRRCQFPQFPDFSIKRHH